MNAPLRDRIVQSMQQKTTGELLAIVVDNDKEEWSDDALEVARLVLRERKIGDISQAIAEQPNLRDMQDSDLQVVTPLKRYEGVRGWLLLFCISLTVLNPLAILALLGASTASDVFHDFRPAFLIQEVLSLAFAAIVFYVGFCLWRVRAGAVKKAKILLWSLAALNVALVCLTLVVGQPSIARKVRVEGMGNAVAAFLWLAYFDSSKRVQSTYKRDMQP